MSPTGILIAEGQKTVANELKGRLEALGYKVAGIIDSGEQAVEATEKLKPELVLMNVQLRGTNSGIMTGSLIHTLHGIPVIYLVDYSTQATIRRAGVTGPFGYIFRPFDEKQIFTTIETALVRHKMERKLEQSRQWLNTTLTSIGDGVIATDEQEIVRFINPVASELTGWRHTDAIGKSLSEIFVLVDESSRRRTEDHFLREINPDVEVRKGFDGLLLSTEGTTVPVEASVTTIKDGKGRVYGRVLIFRDVTQQKAALQEIRRQADRAEALRQVASQLNSQLELGTVLNIICDITNGAIKASGTAVLLLTESGDIFRVMAAITQDPLLKTYQEPGFEVRREVFENFLSRENSVVVIDHVQEDPNLPFADMFREADIQTIAMAALFRGRELVGVLSSAFTRNPKLLPEDEIELLRGLADQASTAIENAELFEQVRAGRERQRQLAKSLVDVQEAERRRIAKELHDHFGQVLTGLQFMLESTKNQATGKQRANLEEIQNTVSDIIGQIRELSLNLRPSMLDDMGLLPTLRWHFDRYTSQTGITVNFRCDDFPKRLPLEIETAAYRIIQEALTNVARYAGVEEVLVGLVIQDKTLWVEVLDNGKGFDVAAVSDRPTSGLGGMRERASLLGGYLIVESFIEQGTQIVGALPVAGQPLERRRYERNRSVS